MHRRTVLHRINIQARFQFILDRLIETFDPFAHLLQIVRPRGDNQQAVQALHRDDLDHTAQGPLTPSSGAATAASLTRPQHRGQGIAHLGHRSMLQREYANGHPLEEIHIETVDNIQPTVDLTATASQHDEVAQGIHTQERFGRRQRLEDFRHFSGTDIAQGNDDRTKPLGQGIHAVRPGGDVFQPFRRAQVIQPARITHQ
jgi:GNAT superfamily N-acetyltransferase